MSFKNILLSSIFLFSFNSFAVEAKDNEFDKIKYSKIMQMKNKSNRFIIYTDRKEVEKVNLNYTEIIVSYDTNNNHTQKYIKHFENNEYLPTDKSEVKGIYFLSGHQFKNDKKRIFDLFNPLPKKENINFKMKEIKNGNVNFFSKPLLGYRKIIANKLKAKDGGPYLFKNEKSNFIKVENYNEKDPEIIIEQRCSNEIYGKVIKDKYINYIDNNPIKNEKGIFYKISVKDCKKETTEDKYLYLGKITASLAINVRFITHSN